MTKVTVRVPATTSNLGSGFDTLGIALRLYNEAVLCRATERVGQWTSVHQKTLSAGARAMIAEAAACFFKRSRKRAFEFDVSLRGKVPVARGLGSSVTVRLGVVAGLNELAGKPLSCATLLDLVNDLEHHPDNAAPALYGGFAVAGPVARTVRCLHMPVSPRLKFVTLIPRFEVSTEKARKLVPAAFPKADTIHSLNRAALISAAFAAGDYDALRGLFDDRVHQPYRERLIPKLSQVIRAGERAGALGGWLSGSGSTIICITLKNAAAVGQAMQRQLRASDVLILTADPNGTVVRSS